MKGEIVEKIIGFLKNSSHGLTITELVNISKLSRSSIRTGLAKLEGAKRVVVRQIGMAKVYSLLSQKK